jgi:hypothetical protein
VSSVLGMGEDFHHRSTETLTITLHFITEDTEGTKNLQSSGVFHDRLKLRKRREAR